MPYFTIEFISICHKENNKGWLQRNTPAQILSLRTRCLLWKHLSGVSVSLLLCIHCLMDSSGFRSACVWTMSRECAWCQESKLEKGCILEDDPLSDVPAVPAGQCAPGAGVDTCQAMYQGVTKGRECYWIYQYLCDRDSTELRGSFGSIPVYYQSLSACLFTILCLSLMLVR